jgi:CheY-like chemotaxis protein
LRRRADQMHDVLIIDDQMYSLKAFAMILEDKYKCNLHYAVDLTEAFQKLRERNYTFIVLDVAIDLGEEEPEKYTPEYAGLHILDYIEAYSDENIKVPPDVPIIVISIYVNDFRVAERLEKSRGNIRATLSKSEEKLHVFREVVSEIISQEGNKGTSDE